jgi:hypothetical protein
MHWQRYMCGLRQRVGLFSHPGRGGAGCRERWCVFTGSKSFNKTKGSLHKAFGVMGVISRRFGCVLYGSPISNTQTGF